VLEHKGSGFAQAIGNTSSALCFVGEALGKNEAYMGTPFVGDAGVYLNRAFRRLGLVREQQRIGNVISCRPPNDWLVNSPWESMSIAHCFAHRRQLDGHKVYVTLGVTATRVILKELLNIDYSGKMDHWHGYVLGNEEQGYVVPTYHPAYLLRGNQNLFGTVLHDITRAMEVASYGYQEDQIQTIEDPSPAAFADYIQHVPDDPNSWMAVDLETVKKQHSDEDELLPSETDSPIRISFSFHPDQGVSVPWEPRYYPMIREALSMGCAKLFHNERYDVPILNYELFPIRGTILDSMWAWHFLQSDVPKSLGFVAPFYSKLPPWKHLSHDRPAYYSAMDSIQTMRIMLGIAKHLKEADQWEAYLRYSVLMDSQVLHPMERVGIGMSREKLKTLEANIDGQVKEIFKDLSVMYPKELIPHDGGWKRQPKETSPYFKDAFKVIVKEEVLVCTDCGEYDVGPKHKCKKEAS
jgi:DNA polymerase